MRSLRSLFRELRGKHEPRLLQALRGQLHAATDGARLAREVVRGRIPPDEGRERISRVEHHGDRCRADLVDALGRALVTPFDREDLFRLSRSIDDVLDQLRDFVREYDLLDPHDGEPFVPLLDGLIDGIERLELAVRDLIQEPQALTQGALGARKAGNQVRFGYQLAMADLPDTGVVEVETWKRQELLRRLDRVGERLGEAANALADGAMKRSH